jgi:hypothetical protein
LNLHFAIYELGEEASVRVENPSLMDDMLISILNEKSRAFLMLATQLAVYLASCAYWIERTGGARRDSRLWLQ